MLFYCFIPVWTNDPVSNFQTDYCAATIGTQVFYDEALTKKLADIFLEGSWKLFFDCWHF